VTDGLQEILGQKLRKVILYGSYARGDFDDESDIDIVALADVNEDEYWGYWKKIGKIVNSISLKNEILTSISLINISHFFTYLEAIPFYQNVMKDGLELYGL
jgi:predicted nucleotidyltransferase